MGLMKRRGERKKADLRAGHQHDATADSIKSV